MLRNERNIIFHIAGLQLIPLTPQKNMTMMVDISKAIQPIMLHHSATTTTLVFLWPNHGIQENKSTGRLFLIKYMNHWSWFVFNGVLQGKTTSLQIFDGEDWTGSLLVVWIRAVDMMFTLLIR